MAIIRFPDENRSVTDPDEVRQLLESLGVWYENWEVAGRVGPDAGHEEILAAYEPEIQRLKDEFGFVMADAVSLTPETPNLDDVLESFGKEHTHDDDEVRFIVRGHGVFFVHLAGDRVASMHVESGDLLNVPGGTKHWFRLCEDRTVCCIRLFKKPDGWKAEFVEDGLQENYPAVCTTDRA